MKNYIEKVKEHQQIGSSHYAEYAFHFFTGIEINGGTWVKVRLEDHIPDNVVNAHGAGISVMDIRKEVYDRLVNQFKAELYSKMYKVELGEAIIKVESGLVEVPPPPKYETYTF